MTVDHTIPVSRAKEFGMAKEEIESLDNKQPMCDYCNGKKGNNFTSDEEYRLHRMRNGTPSIRKGVEVIFQLVHNNNIFNRDLEGVM